MPITTPPNIRYPISLLDVGDSFFVPTLHAGAPMRDMRKLAAEMGIEIAYVSGIDIATNLYGIRVYRTR